MVWGRNRSPPMYQLPSEITHPTAMPPTVCLAYKNPFVVDVGVAIGAIADEVEGAVVVVVETMVEEAIEVVLAGTEV
jgi:hypothetical protein